MQAACALPDPPSALSAAFSASAVSLTWSASRYAVDYVVLVGTAPGASNVELTSTTQPDYQLEGLTAGAYYAQVRSHNWCGTSEPSSEIEFSVPE
jgi:fibronectin type III domain protein